MPTTETPTAGLSVTRRRLLTFVGWEFCQHFGGVLSWHCSFSFPDPYEPAAIFQLGNG